MYDIIIIGAGPAGLTSAIYALRSNKKVLVLEAKVYGGQIVNASFIDNYPGMPHVSGYDFATKLYNQAINLGAEIKFEKAIDIEVNSKYKKVKTKDNEYLCTSVIIATGADKRKLGIDKEEELLGKGISYCATCDGMFFKNKDVAVVGGGNAAICEAKYLSTICNKVYLIHRREEFRADLSEVESIKKIKNIELILNTKVTKLNGLKSLESIEITDDSGNTKELNVHALFISIGQIPDTGNLIRNIKTTDEGYIIAKEDMKTNIEGVFVAGDIRSKAVRQLTTAVCDGTLAALSACKYINQK